MGHNPIPPPPRRIVLTDGSTLTLPYRRPVPRSWRRSIFPWRRRRCIDDCRTHIVLLELDLGFVREAKIVAPPKPSDASRSVRPPAPPKPASPTWRHF